MCKSQYYINFFSDKVSVVEVSVVPNWSGHHTLPVTHTHRGGYPPFVSLHNPWTRPDGSKRFRKTPGKTLGDVPQDSRNGTLN